MTPDAPGPARLATESAPVRAGYGDVLTIGFATATAMWICGYVSHWPGVSVAPPAIFAALVAILLAGGFEAGRVSQRGFVGGLLAGGVTGLINLLLLGAVLRSIEGASLPAAALWVPGSVLATIGICGVGAALAPRAPEPRRREIAWPARFAWVACAATLALLTLGGIVTGFEAGLAVPDWPNSYGYNMFLYPLAKMTGGIFFEHSHRLLGTLVGLATLALATYVQCVEPRRWVRRLAWVAFAAVVVQGVMGGLRVTGRLTLATEAQAMSPSVAWAVVHGVFAQMFFALMASLAIVLGPRWHSAQPQAGAGRGALDRTLCVLSLAALLMQLVWGALLRHQAWGLLVHVSFALVVVAVVGTVALRAWALAEDAALERWGLAALMILGAQVALGIVALVAITFDSPDRPSPFGVLATTAHQTTGAVLLATSAALTLWRFRLDAGADAQPADARPAASAAPLTP